MARRMASSATPVPQKLPQVSFVKVQEDGSTQPSGVHDNQARSYGYNDFSDFHRPEHYIRHIEPLESELAVQVEYDMDEQDKEWLNTLNAERKKEQLDKVSYEAFEIVMDRLEKEWFDLTKNIPKPDFAMPSEDSTCSVCDDSEGENSNAIVFCDGCNLAVHQDCYGVPYIPEGQWLCRKCTVSPENPVSCILCPNEGGAFKQTVLGEWVHLLCAIWVPETRVANDVFMEPITGVDKISKQRWKLRCCICDIREGACIQCAKNSCFLAFHVTCARKEKLLMPMKTTQSAENVTLMCFCEKHLPKEQLQVRNTAIDSGQISAAGDNEASPRLSKSARAYAKTYKPGPPLVPSIIVDRITQYIGKMSIRKKSDVVLLMCKYWSLKREARRGAPLLKRLHLEPWTASAGNKQQTEQEKAMKLELLQHLRKDLENVRTLAELSRKRESRKLKQAEIIQDIFSRCLFSHEPPLRLAFERIMSLDRQEYFKSPVSKIDVPDYFDIVKKPMCWNVIDGKLDRHEYWDIQSFKDDIQLVVDNAILYNKSGTPFYKTAQRIASASQPILKELDRLSRASARAIQVNGNEPSDTQPHAASFFPVGDLEPPLDLLQLLFSPDAIKDDTDLVLDKEPLVSLFDFDLGKFKPPPPPPTPPPPRSKAPKRKLGRPPKGSGDKKAQDDLDTSPGFRAPRTRSALIAAAAVSKPVLEAESKSIKKGSGIRSEVPPMVDHVDNHSSFKMFDAGWILPPDQKRGRRAPVDLGDLPKKRIRTDRGTSRLLYSTPAFKNQTLRSITTVKNTNQGGSAQGHVAMDVDISPGHSTTMPKALGLRPDPKSRKITMNTFHAHNTSIVRDPNGTMIIEELDSPATRREKNMRRKAERLLQPSSSPVVGPSHLTVTEDDEGFEVESALSSLSEAGSGPDTEMKGDSVDVGAEEDVDAEGDPDTDAEGDLDVNSGAGEDTEAPRAEGETEEDLTTMSRKSASTPRNDQTSQVLPATPNAQLGTIVLRDGKSLEGGTLVWAKASSYPWWPAVIFEVDDQSIPKAVLHAKETVARHNPEGPLHLVRFFDRNKSWQWIALNNLKLLGEDKSLDELLLAATSRFQKWKSAKIRQECRNSYRDALAEMETNNDPEGGVEVNPVVPTET